MSRLYSSKTVSVPLVHVRPVDGPVPITLSPYCEEAGSASHPLVAVVATVPVEREPTKCGRRKRRNREMLKSIRTANYKVPWVSPSSDAELGGTEMESVPAVAVVVEPWRDSRSLPIRESAAERPLPICPHCLLSSLRDL